MKAQKIITGFILAGGKSSRMGKDKGLLRIDGKTLVERIIDVLKPAVNSIVIVANSDDYNCFGYPVIEDLVKDIGPLGGIYTGLSHSQTAHNFFISCDMPFVDSEAIAHLISKAEEGKSTIATFEGAMQPLFGIYSKSALPTIEQHIAANKLKLREFILYLDYQLVEMDILLKQNTLLFQNLNTPEEYEEALKKWKLWNVK